MTIGTAGAVSSVLGALSAPAASEGRMPVLFVGHGTPMHAIEDTAISRTWADIGRALPAPRAVLCVSAHWETDGVRVTTAAHPETIHDFSGFPEDLFACRYPAPGSPGVADEARAVAGPEAVGADPARGLDHGAWAVLRRMYPKADVPVVQVSLDRRRAPAWHVDFARSLAPLRERGVLIVASGNAVHNLGRLRWEGPAWDWALEFDAEVKRRIVARDLRALAEYPALGPAASLAVPTNEHFLPLLYTLALQRKDEDPVFFTETVELGAIGMRGVRFG